MADYDMSSSMNLHIQKDTPIRVAKLSQGSVTVKIGNHPMEVTLFLRKDDAERFRFAMEEATIVVDTPMPTVKF